jgi:predicted transcriptional regulator
MPNSKSRETSILSEPYAVDLLLFLAEKESMMSVDLKEIHTNYPKMVSLARSMSNLGLISIIVENRPRVTHTYTLTEKGKMVAEKLKEIEGIITE